MSTAGALSRGIAQRRTPYRTINVSLSATTAMVPAAFTAIPSRPDPSGSVITWVTCFVISILMSLPGGFFLR